MVIILFMWFLLIFYGIKKNYNEIKPFEPRQMMALRGICAIEIMMGHIGIETGSKFLFPNRKAGILFVGIFFLLSGYGVAYSTENKKDYLKNFLLNRSVRLLFPVYFIKILMIIFENSVLLDRKIFAGIDVKQFLISVNWYVWEQLFFYFIYWLAHKVIPKYVEAAVGISSVVLIIVAYICRVDNPWYGSSLCFFLGLCYYRLEKKNIKLAGARYYVILGVLSVFLGVSIVTFFVLGNDSILGNPIARNISSMSFCIIVVMLLERWRIGNPVSVFLGKCSYEIFLVHPYVLSMLRHISIESESVLGIATIVLTVTIAYIIHLVIMEFWRMTRISHM